ncbi:MULTISPECIES: Hpt domain-containing response regulator [Roseivirga]|jgi:CheY-like chemotaxis protein/HPt (histidine-containing phosphotransfer) domain-containing protein|uniref:Response regulatory domain-containing protein n=1 Tax=Roseivirga thermotolerans TaxID=1758176 RepID=A0ABQ3I7E0_9BACT|nr:MULTISPECIES: response regulator [Roseivirga]MEC7754127.1 response regulator [Bacteroidota bacterium]GHE60576.1 hypothetical protein GCM10011340_14320 [Roseivirga thermotolerans]|tara:strand:- start:28000 stop:28752 length:753 start_codon:yes stop_codon:yes gene_type:complete
MNNRHNSILVIDDNDINRKYLKSVLSNNSLEPVLVESGYRALEELRLRQFDLILVDIQMPEMDGFECYNRIKEEFGLYCPVLAITAFSDNADKKQIIEFGFNDYILKPVKPNVLVETIKYWITNFSKTNGASPFQEDEHVDEEVIQDLLRYTDKDSLLLLIDEFVEETKSNLQSISFLKSNHKYTEILSILHNIKGNAGSFGFTTLSSMASTIESYIKEEKWDRAVSILDEFLEYGDFLFKDHRRLLKIY